MDLAFRRLRFGGASVRRDSAAMKGRWAALLLLVLGACSDTRIPAQPPLSATWQSGSTIHVEAAEEARLDDLIDAGLFAGFSPDEPLEAIVGTHGIPLEVTEPRGGERYYVYQVPAGVLWTGYQQTADGTVHRLIQLRPHPVDVESVVRPLVWAQLPRSFGSYWIVLYASGQRGALTRIEVNGDSVSRVLWFGPSTPGQRPAESHPFPG
jgi:hypothetical protein